SKLAIRAPNPPAPADSVKGKYHDLPLSFVPNEGQADRRIRYSAQAPGLAVSFTRSEALFSFVTGKEEAALALQFLNSNPRAVLTGANPLPGRVNYLIGDRGRWHTNLPTYGRVLYRDMWPGVDVAFSGDEGQ